MTIVPRSLSKILQPAAIGLVAFMAGAVWDLDARASGAPSGPPVLMPVDEAARDPGFLAFRAELLEAIRARDVEAVAAVAHPDIKLSFGGDYGRESFHRWLAEDRSYGGVGYWEELERALELGGVFEGPDSFCTPYVFCLEIPGCEACDPYETLVAVTERAPIHAAPDGDSPIVATLSYGVVTVLDSKHYPWSRVRVPGQSSSTEGYATAPAFRSPIDYRGRFERQADGAWLLTFFLAGD